MPAYRDGAKAYGYKAVAGVPAVGKRVMSGTDLSQQQLTHTCAVSRLIRRAHSSSSNRLGGWEGQVFDVGLLHFGEPNGNTLLQVARNDPDYVRRLALTAQRPQVHAAARELVVAIEASEQAAQRGRAKTRRVRADGR